MSLNSSINRFISNQINNKEVDLINEIKECKKNNKQITNLFTKEQNKLILAEHKKIVNNSPNPKDAKNKEIIYKIAISLISKDKIKFSNNTFPVLGDILRYLIDDIVEYSLINLKSTDKKKLTVENLLSSDIKESKLYSLLNISDTYKNLLNDTEDDKEEKNISDEEKIASISEEKDMEYNKFTFYIKKVFINKSTSNEDDKNKKFKKSTEFIKLVANIVIDILNKASNSLEVWIKTNEKKIVDENMFKRIIITLMISNSNIKLSELSDMECLKIIKKKKRVTKVTENKK